MYNIKKDRNIEAVEIGENGLLKPKTLISIKMDKSDIATGTLTNGISGRGVFRKKKNKKNKPKRKKDCGCK